MNNYKNVSFIKVMKGKWSWNLQLLLIIGLELPRRKKMICGSL